MTTPNIIDSLADDKIYTVLQLARLSQVPTHHVRAWLKDNEIKPVPALSLGNWYSGKHIRDALKLAGCIPVPSKYSVEAQNRAFALAK